MAVITANLSADLATIDLNRILVDATAVTFYDNANFVSPQSYGYQDILRVAYDDDVPTFADFGGSGFIVDPSTGQVTGGTVTGYLEYRFNGSTYVPALAVEGFSYSAVAVYNATVSASTADDMVIWQSILNGADTFNLSNQADTADGFAGNDTLRGNGGNDLLIGGAGNDSLDGGTGSDELHGDTGNDWLYGGSGASGNDELFGGPGNDTYVVNSADLDDVTEFAGQGTDTVRSSVTRTLGPNQEHLVLIGSNAINGTGNSQTNTLTGNSAANTLNGGSGADKMAGGAGNDTYLVDNAGDLVTEAASAGTDSVRSGVTRTLGANQEDLVLTGTAAINGTGNTLVNTLTGNAAANTLNGGTNADKMAGGAGNDTYVVDNAGDIVTEAAAAGADTVRSSVTRALGVNQENLVLTGTAAINGTGNTLANTLTGNAAANTLSGGSGKDQLSGAAGNDLLKGGLGNDTLTGGTGLDQFRFADTLGTSNVDRIADFVSADDHIRLEDAMFAGIGPVGALAAAAFRVGAAAADASDRIIYNIATGALSFDADGTGAEAAVVFAMLTPGTSVVLGDFFII